MLRRTFRTAVLAAFLYPCPYESFNTHLPRYFWDTLGNCDISEYVVCKNDFCGSPEGEQGWAQYCVWWYDVGATNGCYG
jgi:hypothetical protein